MYISPTGRIEPRRFTGLTAKEQRKLQRAIKLSRQLALLPFCSRYPEPTTDQLLQMSDEVPDFVDFRSLRKEEQASEEQDASQYDEEQQELEQEEEYDVNQKKL